MTSDRLRAFEEYKQYNPQYTEEQIDQILCDMTAMELTIHPERLEQD